jgi:iron complex outermembrane recepter protein
MHGSKTRTACLAAAMAGACALAASAAEGPADLTELSLEELSNVEVTSVSRRKEPLSDSAAAVTVISGEDLRRSGATTVPEALRLAPGLHVGQVSGSDWEVSARGFSSVQSAKVLVLSDTRSIYTPLFAGVFWNVQDFLLEDLDRIEVVRGPGASLWGSNAVNGVINIISRSSRDTQGAYFEGGVGTEDRGFGAVRYGGQLNDHAWFRVFAKGVDRAGEFDESGRAADEARLGHLGFRADWEAGAKDLFTFQGDAYAADIGQVIPSVTILNRPGPSGKLVEHAAGGNLLARWTHTFSAESQLEARIYYDGTHRDDPAFLDDLDTVDFDLQHRFQLPLRQQITWGAGLRVTDNRNHGKGVFELDPPESRDTLVSGFVQDQIALLDSLKLTLGTKLEHNDFSGFEIQPTARVAWVPSAPLTVWGAVSRAVQVPTRLERDVDIAVTDPTQDPVAKLLGNRSFSSEKLLAWELGLRWELDPRLSVDLAAYLNVYHGLASLEFDTPFVDPQNGQTVVPVVDKNLTDGIARGGEASVTLAPVRFWRLVGNYTHVLVTLNPKGQDLNHGILFTGSTPRNQVGVRSLLDLPGSFQLDAFFRYADGLPSSAQLSAGQDTPAYATVDLRIGWHGVPHIDFSVMARSLLQAHHREFPGGTELRRGVYLKVAGRF